MAQLCLQPYVWFWMSDHLRGTQRRFCGECSYLIDICAVSLHCWLRLHWLKLHWMVNSPLFENHPIGLLGVIDCYDKLTTTRHLNRYQNNYQYHETRVLLSPNLHPETPLPADRSRSWSENYYIPFAAIFTGPAPMAQSQWNNQPTKAIFLHAGRYKAETIQPSYYRYLLSLKPPPARVVPRLRLDTALTLAPIAVACYAPTAISQRFFPPTVLPDLLIESLKLRILLPSCP